MSELICISDEEKEFIRLILDGTITVDWLTEDEFDLYNELRKKFGLSKLNKKYLSDKNFE